MQAIISRYLALLVVIVLSHFTNQTQFFATVTCIGLAHYVLALIYSKKAIFRLNGQRTLQIKFGLWIVAAIAMARYNLPPILFYFGLHHALTESYCFEVSTSDWFNKTSVKASRFWFVLFSYLVVLGETPPLNHVPHWIFLGGFIVPFVLFCWQLISASKMPRPLSIWPVLLYELPLCLILVLSFYVTISFLQVILYHFLFWAVLPFLKKWDISKQETLKYVFLSVGVTTFFYLLLPASGTHWAMPIWKLAFFFWIFGGVHISLSFAMSAANPDFIVRFFGSSKIQCSNVPVLSGRK